MTTKLNIDMGEIDTLIEHRRNMIRVNNNALITGVSNPIGVPKARIKIKDTVWPK